MQDPTAKFNQAVDARSCSEVKLLLRDDRVQVNRDDGNGRTALLRAIARNDAEMVATLLACPQVAVSKLKDKV